MSDIGMDGTAGFALRSGVDGGNWWIDAPSPTRESPGRGSNFKARTGLYASAFRLEGDAAELEFRPGGDAVWLI